MKGQKFSLIGALAAALLFSAAFVPQANAFVVVVYNFEDSTVGGPPDFTSDVPPGQQNPLMTTDYNVNDISSVSPSVPLNNVAPGDLDPNLLAIQLSHAKSNEGSCFQFTVNTIGLSQMSLSFAYNNNGNGFTTATFQYSLDAGANFTTFGTSTLTTGGNFVASADVPVAANNQASVVFQICFTGGTSNGNNIQTVIDNVRLDAIPEPSTVMSGLLSVGGLCWVQRRRLIQSIRLRRR
jgi:hypothetical protein